MPLNKKEFSKRLNEMLDKANLPKKGKGRQASLASLFAVSQESARKWICGESLPDIKRIPGIAAAFKENVKTALKKGWDGIEWAWAETEIGAYCYLSIKK